MSLRTRDNPLETRLLLAQHGGAAEVAGTGLGFNVFLCSVCFIFGAALLVTLLIALWSRPWRAVPAVIDTIVTC